MGCFNVLKYIRKKLGKSNSKHDRNNESVPTSYGTSSRTRAFSTPLAPNATQQETKLKATSMKEYDSPSPQPLPLPPSPNRRTVSMKEHRAQPLPLPYPPLKISGSNKSGTGTGTQQEIRKLEETSMKEHHSPSPQPLPLPSSPTQRSVSMKERRAQPLPLPYPPLNISGSNKSGTGTSIGSIRYFSNDEITAAIHDFSSNRCVSECLTSTIYKASFGDDPSSTKMLEATVNFLHPSTQGLREFINEVNKLVSLQHPNICKLLGFHAHENSETRVLVYERLWHGSLDHLLFVKSDGPLIDWNMRMKIALCAAQGLTFLHEEGPLQAMYSDFSAANIQIDKDFIAKLSGYGCVGRIHEEEFLTNSTAAGNLSKETLKKGMLTPKSNVWSFGIVLLELLTGRKNFDSNLPKEERNLIKWCRPFLVNDTGLSQIMDPQLKCEFPPEAAKAIAETAQRCLQKEPSERPTMRAIVEHLTMIQESTRAVSWKPMSRSTSVSGIISQKWSVSPTMLPHPHASSSNISAVDLDRQEST